MLSLCYVSKYDKQMCVCVVILDVAAAAQVLYPKSIIISFTLK